jgi:CheY-like chemotaxis protein
MLQAGSQGWFALRWPRVRGLSFQFANFTELAQLIDVGYEEQELPLGPTCPGFADGDWVLVSFQVGKETTSVAACIVDRGGGLQVHFEDRDWTTLQDFVDQTLVSNSTPSIPPPPTPETVTVEGMRVLLVDGDRETRLVVEKLLQSSGYSVSAADSAEQALELLQKSPVRLVMLEWNLPGMSGVEFCRTLRGTSLAARLPILFLSTYSDSERVVQAFESGADDYVTKPFRALELSARVMGLLRRAGM